MKEHAVIYNPSSAAGKSRASFQQALDTLERLGVSFDTFKSERPGHTIELAEQLGRDGYRLIGCGGDGTCNEVLNGAIASGKKPLVGFIPVGSGNDIPGAIGILPDVTRACEIIAGGFSEPCDIGKATGETGDPRYFVGIGSQGFDAEVTRRANKGRKRFSGTRNYVVATLAALTYFKARDITVSMDHDTFEGEAILAAVGNGPSYGGWMYMCAGACIHDGMFHVVILGKMSKLRLLGNFNKMYTKEHLALPAIHSFESAKVRIDMMDDAVDPYLYQVDGEVSGTLPVEYTVLPDGYEFIKPRENEVLLAFNETHRDLVASGKIKPYDWHRSKDAARGPR